MPEENLHQPHDKLVRLVFGQREHAVAAFRAWLPEEVTRELDFERAELMPASFVDEQFQGAESDLVWWVPVRQGGGLFLYVLFEHMTREHHWVPLRLDLYRSQLWLRFMREHPEPCALPLVLPIVLTQSATPWRQEPQFRGLFRLTPAQEELWRPIIPDFTFYLVELAAIPFDKIIGTPLGIFALQALKAEGTDDLLNDAVWDVTLFRQLSWDELRLVMRYLYGLNRIDPGVFERKIAGLSDPEIRERAMTLAEHYTKKGEATGEAKGILFGQIRLLESITGRSKTPVEELRMKPEEELRELYAELCRQAGIEL